METGHVLHSGKITYKKKAYVLKLSEEEVILIPEDRKGSDPIVRRKVLIFINPFGGTKKAVRVFEEQVRPIFAKSLVDVEVLLTTRAGHAKEHMATVVNIDAYDAFVTVSGDGLLHEVLNGLLARADWQQALQKPLGIIPCGSGNAMAKSIDVPNVLAATLAIIKGHAAPLDLISIRQAGHAPYFGHLLVMWGLVADIDIESEKYRWAGAARFTMSGIGRIVNLRKYRGRLSYLPWFPEEAAAVTQQATTDAEYPAPPSAWLAEPPTAPGWHTIEGPFVTVLALNTGWQSLDAFMAPFSSINDGCMDLVYILGSVSSTHDRLASIFLDLETGKHVYSPVVHYVKVRAFRLEPQQPTGTMDVDGELVENSTVAAQILPGAARIFCPAELRQPAWDASNLPRGGLRVPSSVALSSTASPPTTSASALSTSAPSAATEPPTAGVSAAASSSPEQTAAAATTVTSTAPDTAPAATPASAPETASAPAPAATPDSTPATASVPEVSTQPHPAPEGPASRGSVSGDVHSVDTETLGAALREDPSPPSPAQDSQAPIPSVAPPAPDASAAVLSAEPSAAEVSATESAAPSAATHQLGDTSSSTA